MKKNFIKPLLDLNFTYVVLVVAFLTILAFTRLQFFYNYDEVIVYTISQQSLPQLFDTIKAEPHPPGLYLLLHFLTPLFSSQIELKSVIIIISASLFWYAIRYAQVRHILDNYKLHTGLILFISSFTFLTVASHLKQDSITAPLFILLFFAVVQSWRTKDLTWRKYLLPIILQLLLLCFGYISFAFGTLLLWGSLAVQIKTNKTTFRQILPMLTASFSLILLYFYSFGFEQIQMNQGRFAWSAYGHNALSSAISVHLSGFLPSHPIHLLSVGVFTLFIFFSFLQAHSKQVSQKLVATIFGIVWGFTLIYYYTELFVQARYGVFMFFFLSILAGWGVDFILSNKMLKKVFLISVCMFALCNFLVFEQADRSSWLAKADLVEATVNAQPDQHFGLLFDHSLYQHIFRLQYFPNASQLLPINITAESNIFESNQITQTHLRLDANLNKDISEYQIQHVLQSAQKSNFIYIANQVQYQTHFTDPEQKLLKHLSSHCTLSKQTTSGIHIFHVFTNCYKVNTTL